MNNNIQQNKLDENLLKLEGLEKEFLNKFCEMLDADNSNMYPMDLLAVCVFKRSVSIIHGFTLLIRERNFICAAPLLRLQIDSALRFFAPALVNNPHELANNCLKGIHINKFKDENTGKRLTDSYLVEILDNQFPWLKRVYENTSGYIHLSEKHYFNATGNLDEKNRTVTHFISSKDEVVTIEGRNEAVEAMIEISNMVLWILDSWIFNKQNPGIKQKILKERNNR